MSAPLAFFVAAVALGLLVTTGTCAVFVALAYEAGGFRRAALTLVFEHLRRHIPHGEPLRFQTAEVAQLAALQRLVDGADASFDCHRRDLALAVLAGKGQDHEFLSHLEQRRCECQEAQLVGIERRLDAARDRQAILRHGRRWVATRERRLRWLSLRELVPLVAKNAAPWTNAWFGYGAAAAYAAAIVVTMFLALATNHADIGVVMADTTLIFGALSIAAAWVPLVRRANAELRGHVSRTAATAGAVALAVAFVLSAGVETLLMLGVWKRWTSRMQVSLDQALNGIHLSPAVWAGVGLFIVNALFARIPLSYFRIARARHVVVWERVSAGGAFVAWSSLVPIDIWMGAGLISHGTIGYAPQWIRAWIFACWGASLALYVCARAIRRRQPVRSEQRSK